MEKMNEIAPKCFGEAWPVRQALQSVERARTAAGADHRRFRATNEETLAEKIPPDVTHFQVFVSDDALLYSLVRTTADVHR